jgi:hypothetical protein
LPIFDRLGERSKSAFVTKANRIIAVYWIVFAAVCCTLPRLRAGELRRAAWAQSINYDGDPKTGESAVFFAAVGWDGTTLDVATMENDRVACDALLGAIVNGDSGFARELWARGFRRVECNGMTRAIGQPRPTMPQSARPASGRRQKIDRRSDGDQDAGDSRG